tara:strand:+ start:7017 stop:7850 length:834 start_codon:yes stop_codon:yes gene_type:complete
MNRKLFLIVLFSYILFYHIEKDEYHLMIGLSLITAIISHILFSKKYSLYEGVNNSMVFTEEEEDIRRQEQEEQEEQEETGTDDATASTDDSTEDEVTTDTPVPSNTPFVSAEYVKLRQEAREKDGPDGPTMITENDTPTGEGEEEQESSSDPSMFEENEEIRMVPTEDKFRMGPYDGLCISSDKFMENTIIDNDELVTYFGTQIPPHYVKSQDILKGPTVDGKEDSPQKLTMFANNKTSLNCCDESPYMTSTGCVCLTDNQRNFIQSRGLNKTNGDF